MREAQVEEIKFDEETGRKIKTHLWCGTHMSEDGIVFQVPLNIERFQHYESHKTEVSIRFQDMAGWIIMEKLVPIIMYHRPGCIVEIGAGVSTRPLARIAESYGVKFYTCDISAEKNIEYFINHFYFQMKSEEFIKVFDDIPSVVFIDGDHSKEVAEMEFKFFFEKLMPGGVIFLHDTLPMARQYTHEDLCGDVYKLRQLLELRTNEMDCFTWPYTAGYHGLTMVIKKGKNREFWEL